MNKYIFISVNYGTSGIIKDWIDSINKCYTGNKEFIIVDNYKSEEERKTIEKLSVKLRFHLIKSDNIGYGAGLNKGLYYAENELNLKNAIIFAGNLDLEYKNIPQNLNGKYVYVPRVLEGTRNRNPFLTKLQHKITSIYKFAAKYKISYIYYMVIIINKLVGFIPSKIWAVHGSLFCFNLSILDKNEMLFNENSFLYGEELEFASFMHSKGILFKDSEIIVEHSSHVCTKEVNDSTQKFLDLWSPSFLNWDKRWN